MSQRLTALSHGAGCACKMPLGLLQDLMEGLFPSRGDERILVGPDQGDDAAVWRDASGATLVASTDFFTPVVDDPEDWGRIAAANAASDVYAMGGRPMIALNVVGWPKERDLTELRATLAGGNEIAAGGGWVVAGGHTIDAREPFYGQVVIGRIDGPILTNTGAPPGQALVLTKAIGTGIVMTAAKRNEPAAVAPGGELHVAYTAALASMTRLNADASAVLIEAGATAATDVTGFGLLGHLHRFALASGVSVELDTSAVPLLPEVEELRDAGFVPGGTRSNLETVAPHVRGGDDAVALLLADAQTSGGLVASLPVDMADEVVGRLRGSGHEAALIGCTATGEPGTITLR